MGKGNWLLDAKGLGHAKPAHEQVQNGRTTRWAPVSQSERANEARTIARSGAC